MMNNNLSRLILTIILIVGLLAFIGFIIFSGNKQDSNKSMIPSPIPTPSTPLINVTRLDKSQVDTNQSIQEVYKLHQFDKSQPVITAVINDIIPLAQKHKFLERAYKDDLIIATPKETIIYTPSTKTIRDIESSSIYDELSVLLN